MTKPKTKDQLQKRGRKSAFRPEYIRIAEVAAKFGAIEEEIARELGVSRQTFNSWKNSFPELLDALKPAKAAADDRVARSLYHRAIGYSYRAEKVVTVALGNGAGSEVRVVEYTEHVPPDVTAQIFFLKNRRPDEWRDVQRIDAAMGHYVLSERPLTIDEWVKERTIAEGGEPKTIEHEPADRKSNS